MARLIKEPTSATPEGYYGSDAMVRLVDGMSLHVERKGEICSLTLFSDKGIVGNDALRLDPMSVKRMKEMLQEAQTTRVLHLGGRNVHIVTLKPIQKLLQ